MKEWYYNGPKPLWFRYKNYRDIQRLSQELTRICKAKGTLRTLSDMSVKEQLKIMAQYMPKET